MDTYIDRRVVMHTAVEEFGTTKMPSLVRKEGAASGFATLKVKCAELNKLIEDYDDATKGRTKAKQAAADVLRLKGPSLCGALYNIGYKANDEELKAKTDISVAEWAELSEMDLYNETISIVNIAKTKIADLAAFEYTEESVNQIEAEAEAYKSKLGRRDLSQAEKKNMRKEIYHKTSEIGTFLKKVLDKAMLTFKVDDPTLYGEYMAVRNIKDLGIRHEEPAQPENPQPENPQPENPQPPTP